MQVHLPLVSYEMILSYDLIHPILTTFMYLKQGFLFQSIDADGQIRHNAGILVVETIRQRVRFFYERIVSEVQLHLRSHKTRVSDLKLF